MVNNSFSKWCCTLWGNEFSNMLWEGERIVTEFTCEKFGDY